MARNIPADRLLEMIEIGVTVAGSQKAFAKQAGVSEQYICDIRRGRREPGAKILRYFGLERVVSYRRVDGGTL
jgi:DNA-binding transcriptional regulator YdaS (Cro superfamily)